METNKRKCVGMQDRKRERGKIQHCTHNALMQIGSCPSQIESLWPQGCCVPMPNSLPFPEVSPVVPISVGNHLGIPHLLLVISSLPAQHRPYPSPSCPSVAALGLRGCFPALFFKKTQISNLLQSNHFLSDPEGTWGLMFGERVAGAAAGGLAAALPAQLLLEPWGAIPQEHVSAGRHRSSAKPKGCTQPDQEHGKCSCLESSGSQEGNYISYCATHKARGKPGWAEPHHSGSTSGTVWLVWARFRPSKSIPASPKSEWGVPCYHL